MLYLFFFFGCAGSSRLSVGFLRLWRVEATLQLQLASCGTQAQLPHDMWNFPGSGIEPVSPALAGRLLTSGPPRESGCCYFKVLNFTCSYLPVYTHRRSKVAQLCEILCDPMDCSLPGSSVHGIFQARVLEWVAISFSRGSSSPRSPALQADTLTSEPPGKPNTHNQNTNKEIKLGAFTFQ